MAWTDLPAYAAGRFTVAMAELLRGNFKAIGDPWTSYTPVWGSSGTAPAIGNGTLTGRVMSAGKLTIFSFSLVVGSTTTFGTGSYTFTYPAITAQNFRCMFGNAELLDTSAATVYPRFILPLGTTTVAIADTTPTRISGTVPFTFATGDRIDGTAVYEAA